MADPFFEGMYSGKVAPGPSGPTWRDPDATPADTAEDDLARAEADYQRIRESDSFKAEEAKRGPGQRDKLRDRALGVDAAQALALQPEKQYVSAKNPKHPIVQEFAGTMGEAMGEQRAGVEAEHNVQDLVALANQRQAIYNAGLAEELAKQQRVRQARQQQQQAEQMSAIREADRLHNQAVEELVNAPPLDPGRAREEMWAKASHGRRFGLILSVLGKGLAAAGGLNITSRLEQEVEAEIAANKYNRDFLTTRIGARAGQMQAQQTLYERLREQFDDENTADAAYRASLYDYAVKDYEATLAQFGPAQVDATQLQTMADLKAKQAASKLELQQLIMANPRTVRRAVKSENVVMVDPDTGEPIVVPRWYAKQLAESGLEVSTAVATEAGKEAVQQPGRLQLEGVRQAGSVAAKRAEKEGEADIEVQKQTKEWGTIEQMIGDFEKQYAGDIPTVGLPLTGDRAQRIDVDSFKTMLPQLVIKAITGANFSPEQRDAVMRLTEGNWSDLTDDDFRARLRALKNIASSQRRYLQNPLGAPRPAVKQTSEFSSFKSGIE